MKESIKYLLSKIKLVKEILNNQNFFIVILIILTASASFGLGRLSKTEELKTPLKINYSKENTADVMKSIRGKYVASKNGSKYYLPWCSGSKRISDKNKIWFNSKEKAEKSGYSPASNCKGI